MLPREQSQVIELAYFGGFSHSEIAEMLSAPLGTVKGRMRLGLEKIRAKGSGGAGAPVSHDPDHTMSTTAATSRYALGALEGQAAELERHLGGCEAAASSCDGWSRPWTCSALDRAARAAGCSSQATDGEVRAEARGTRPTGAPGRGSEAAARWGGFRRPAIAVAATAIPIVGAAGGYLLGSTGAEPPAHRESPLPGTPAGDPDGGHARRFRHQLKDRRS